MTEPIVCLLICASDWGCAASHMAFLGYSFNPFYAHRISIFGDRWHFIGGLRYLGLVALAWLGFGNPFAGWFTPCYGISDCIQHIPTPSLWWVGTALLNSLGWQVLKRLHGKVGAWGWMPRWLKQITTAWRVSKTPPPTYDTPGEGED